MSSSGIHDTKPPDPVRQQAGAGVEEQEAGTGRFQEKPVQIVSGGDEKTSRPDTSGWKQNAAQIAGADTGSGAQDDGEHENLPAPKEGDSRSRKESAGQGDRYAKAPTPADGQGSAGRGESVYQRLQPAAGRREGQYQSLARPDGAGRDQENAYQNLPRPDGGGRGDDGVYENPYPTGRGAGRSGEGAYQNLPLPAGTPAGQYENVPPPSGEAVYSEVQPPPDELYETIPAAGDDVYSEVQQPDELYETIPAAGEEGIYSEVGNGEDMYENPYLVSGSKLHDAARKSRRGGRLKSLRNTVKASFKSFVSGQPTSRGEVKALAGNLRMIDQLRSANDGAHATLNRILSSRHAPEQLVASIKDDPKFLKPITGFSRQLPKLAGDPAAATRIMDTLDLPAADRQRFAEDFRTAAGLLDKLYQARFDPQDSGSAFRKFANRRDNPYEQRISRPDFGERESGNLCNWLAYAVSYFEDCAQVMADSARGEDPEIDVRELARDIDRFVSRPAGERIVFGRQQA